MTSSQPLQHHVLRCEEEKEQAIRIEKTLTTEERKRFKQEWDRVQARSPQMNCQCDTPAGSTDVGYCADGSQCSCAACLAVKACARAVRAEARLTMLRSACRKEDQEICQILGRALGYPWYKDDQKNFPGATDADGVCTGDHVGATLAKEAAERIVRFGGGEG